MPFLPLIYAELRKLPKEIDWRWAVIEGVAHPTHCTKWVAGTTPRLSKDGTHEFMMSLWEFDTRVEFASLPEWDGKIQMVNCPLVQPLPFIAREKDFLLWQIDGDEIWQAEQIVQMHEMFTRYPEKNAAFFWCRYFVGTDKVITTRNCFGNQSSYEWHRVWKIKPGQLFRTHEPPIIDGLKMNPFTHAETESRGLVFDHFSWCTRDQVAFKAAYYSGSQNPNAKHYIGFVDRWERFQKEKTWPRPLKELMPWVESFAMVTKI